MEAYGEGAQVLICKC